MREAKIDLTKDAPDGAARTPFNWPLEFPEVFLRESGSFDAFIGNPPFLGGTRISEIFGDAYNDFLAALFATGKKVDLSGFFFRRAFDLVRDAGMVGLIATNTISQGTTRKGSLSAIIAKGGSIVFAEPSMRWPGRASVVTSNLVICRGVWQGDRELGGQTVKYISDLLEAGSGEEWSPKLLIGNQGKCFTGSSILGTGFFIEPAAAAAMIAEDKRNAEVVRPVMGGQELNNAISGEYDRWIIDFFERDFEKASKFVTPFSHIEEHVKPERLKKDPKKYPRLVNTWWKFWHSRQQLYRGIKIAGVERVLARARVSDHHMVDFLDAGIVFSEQLVVFILDQWSDFAIIQSSIHDLWSRRYASTMKNDVRYMPTDCFETFPFPSRTDGLSVAGKTFYQARTDIKVSKQLGLTKLYNRLHDQGDDDPEVQRLREKQVALDYAVAAAYGWKDIDFDHDFRRVSLPSVERMRFTISESARTEVLGRLASLNRRRYQEEVEQGLHGGTANSNKARVHKSGATSPSEPSLDLDNILPTMIEEGD